MQKNPPIREEFNSFKLVQHEFFDTVLLSIPDFLEEISNEEKQFKLPPAMVESMWLFSNQKRDMFFQMSQLTDISAQTDIRALLQQIGAQISSSTAGFQLFGSGTKVVNGIILACMDYKYNSLRGSNYVILFLFLVDRKYFIGNFVTPFDCQKECTNAFLLLSNTLHPNVKS